MNNKKQKNMEENEENSAPPEEDMSVIWYCQLLVKYHWLFFVVFLVIHVSFLAVSGALYATGHDPLPLVFDDLPLDLNNDEMFLRFQAWDNRDRDLRGQTRRKRSTPEFEYEGDPVSFGFQKRPKKKIINLDIAQQENLQELKGAKHIYHPYRDSGHEFINLVDNHHKRFKRQMTGVVSSNTNERRQVVADMELIYETTDGSNLLTKERLLAIKAFEAKLHKSPGFTDYCRTELFNRTHLRCFGLASVLRFFDPSFIFHHNGSVISDPQMKRIPFFLTALYNSTSFRDEMQFFLGRDSELNLAQNIIKTDRIRTQVTFGFPLVQGNNNLNKLVINKNADLERWRTEYGNPQLLPYLKEATKEKLTDPNKEGNPEIPIRVLYFVEQLYWSEARDQVYKDWGFIIGGIVMIIIACWFYLDSLFITLLGMFSIVTSFAGANLIYRYMFEYRYFGIFNVLAVFIVIGIGVDDILIYVGTWRHYVRRNVQDLDVLTSVVFRKASVTMFFTSLSTMVAFFVNTPSTLLAISAFGSFAGLCILVNYLTVVTFIPTVVLIHHLYFDKYKFLCCCNRNKRLKRVVEAPPKAVAWHSNSMHGSGWGSSNSQYSGPPDRKQWMVNNESFGSSNFKPWGLTSDPLYSPYHSMSDPLQIGSGGSSGMGHPPRDSSMSAIHRIPFYHHIGGPAWFAGNQSGGQEHIDDNFFQQPRAHDPLHVDQQSYTPTIRTNSSSASIIPATYSESETVKINTLSERFSNACINFLRGPFFRFISNELVNVIVFVIFFAVTFGNCEAITRLKLGDADIPIFNPNHPFEKSRVLVRDGFLLNPYADTVSVGIVWGLGLQDFSECHRLHYKPEASRCKGKTVWDETFDLNNPEAQLQLLQFCKDIIEPTDELKEKLKLYIDITTGKTDAICFIYYMSEWLEAAYKTTNISQVVDVRLPITIDKMQRFMVTQPNVYDPQYITKITRPFELAIDFFLNNGYTGQPITDKRYDLYKVLRFDFINNINIASKKPSDQKKFIFEKRLKYAAMTVRTTVPSTSVDIDSGVKVMDAWEDFVDTRVKAMPEGMQNGFQAAFTWMWLQTLSSLVIQSGVGLGVSLILAFFVIFLGTGNIITSFAILILLAGVTICCVALITLASWKFSLLEAINMCIVVGLAVDYVVHLAESYHLSVYTNRKDRLRDALERVGMPIIAGACTTLMSAFFMLFGKIVFFIQFGSFLFCTLGFSIIFTLFVMTSFYSLVGPNGDFGSVSGMYKGIKRLCFNT